MNDAPTPLEEAPAALDGGRPLFLKREDVHELGAFKWRGALPALEVFRERGSEAVVTASTGNHGAASAWAAKRTAMRAIVFAPEGASQAKLELLERLGAEVHLVGEDLDGAKDLGRDWARSAGCRSSRTARSRPSSTATPRSVASCSSSSASRRHAWWCRLGTARC